MSESRSAPSQLPAQRRWATVEGTETSYPLPPEIVEPKLALSGVGRTFVNARGERIEALRGVSFEVQPGELRFRQVEADGIELYLDVRLGVPEELVLETKGRRRPHVHAYWEGCAYVV